MYNPDFGIDWDAVRESDKIEGIQSDLSEMNREKELFLLVDKIICNIFHDEDLIKAKLYENLIFNFIRNNIDPKHLNNEGTLAFIIKAYYQILTNKKVNLDNYFYLDRMIPNKNNEIRQEIRKRYLEAKSILLNNAHLLDVEVDYTDTSKTIYEMIIKFQDTSTRQSIFNRIYETHKKDSQENNIRLTKLLSTIVNAFETIILIKGNTDIIEEDRERSSKQLYITNYRNLF